MPKLLDIGQVVLKKLKDEETDRRTTDDMRSEYFTSFRLRSAAVLEKNYIYLLMV